MNQSFKTYKKASLPEKISWFFYWLARRYCPAPQLAVLIVLASPKVPSNGRFCELPFLFISTAANGHAIKALFNFSLETKKQQRPKASA